MKGCTPCTLFEERQRNPLNEYARYNLKANLWSLLPKFGIRMAQMIWPFPSWMHLTAKSSVAWWRNPRDSPMRYRSASVLKKSSNLIYHNKTSSFCLFKHRSECKGYLEIFPFLRRPLFIMLAMCCYKTISKSFTAILIRPDVSDGIPVW